MHSSKHPGSNPKVYLPTLYNTVKSCRVESSSVSPNTCLPYHTLPPTTKNPKASLVYYDEQSFICSDPYNKSKIHCLIMPWDTSLRSLNDLTSKHVAILKHMVNIGNVYSQFVTANNGADGPNPFSKLRFAMGFHALPSLPMLHMHLISLDLESERLKTKHHYNSFASHHFLLADRVISDLEANGEVTINQDVDRYNEMLNGPMHCLWCREPLKGVPSMKSHVPICPKNMSRS
eukprot:Tbor_TRINITY_DN5844_c1_g1::TRINITY_DN5844_c1_g1_i1::g.6771::m.6771/K10863/APTX; aprataxin